MDRLEKLEKIQNFNKESDLHELLLDLLPKMGYKDVTLTHERGNSPEMGKDIVASKMDEVENKKEWTAFVVKKGDVRGTSGGTKEINAQIDECFEFAWHSIVKGKNIKEGAKITKADGTVNYEAEVNGTDVIFDASGKFIKEAKD